MLFLNISVCLLVNGCSNNSKVNEIPDRPNFFLFLADDLGKNDIGYAGNRYVQTPNIDSFAKNGIDFRNMYTPTAMCAPSRSALYTGLYPHSNGCYMNHGATNTHVKTLPVYLKQLGYSVALVNKKHINPKSIYPFDFIKDNQLEEYLKKATSPVCIIYASYEPHGPHSSDNLEPDSVIIPPKWVDTKSTREKLAGYYSDISKLDNEFQYFLHTIHKNNSDTNSIVIFTSDHGYGYFGKWSCYEAGLHVPFFMQSDGFTFLEDDIGALTSFVDIVPTFIELAGGSVPENLDGRSFLPLLKGEKTATHKHIYGIHTTRGIWSGKAYPVRSITNGKFKYIMNLNATQKFQNILTNGRYFGDTSDASAEWKEWLKQRENNKWVDLYQIRPSEELYNLENDPDEMNNLANMPQYNDIKFELKKSLQQWMNQQNDKGLESELEVPLKKH
jgi:uncharacterized sulfatase